MREGKKSEGVGGLLKPPPPNRLGYLSAILFERSHGGEYYALYPETRIS